MASVFTSILGKAGKAIDTLGRATGNILPELRISERLENKGSAALPVATQIQKVQNDPRFSTKADGAGYPNFQQVPNQPAYNTPANQFRPGVNGEVKSATDVFNPSIGGQGAGTGTGSGGSSPYTINTPGTYSGPSEADTIATQKAIYDQAANEIRQQDPLLDQNYDLAKKDIQSGIDESTAAANTQKQTLDSDFGSILKRQLQTKQELDRQRQGTFSALGTLDSSLFQEQQYRGDQAFGEQKAQTETERTKALSSVDAALKAYTDKANTQLGQLAIQYQQGKNAIANALAQNDLASAQAIQNAIDQVKVRAQQVQDTILQFANQAAMLKAQGQDVRLNIGGMSAEPYAQQVAQQLAGLTKAGNSTYVIPTNNVQGSGYISPSGKKYSSYAEYLKSLGTQVATQAAA